MYRLTENSSFACWYQGTAPGQLSHHERKGQFLNIAKAQAIKYASESTYTGREATFSHQTEFYPFMGFPF